MQINLTPTMHSVWGGAGEIKRNWFEGIKIIVAISIIKKRFLRYPKFPFHCCKKGKAIPLQAWTGPEGSRRLRLPDFKTIGT